MTDRSQMSTEVPAGGTRLQGRMPRSVLVVLLTLACLFFAWRGPLRNPR